MYYFFYKISKWPWPWPKVGGHHEHDMRYGYTKYKHYMLRCLKVMNENGNLPTNFNLMYYFFSVSSKWPWPWQNVGGHHEHDMRYVYTKYKHYRLRCLKGIIENRNLPKNFNLMYYFFYVSSKWPWPWQNVGGHHEHNMRYVYTKHKHYRLRCLKCIIENGNLPKNFNLMYYFFYISSKWPWPWPKVGGHHEQDMRYVYTKYKHYRLRCLKGIIENGNLPKNFNHVLFLLHKFKMTLTKVGGHHAHDYEVCVYQVSTL